MVAPSDPPSSWKPFSGLDPNTIVRLTIIVGGYIILRPLLEIFFRRLFASQNALEAGEEKMEKMLADETIPDAEEDQDPREEKGFEWGDPARRRESNFMGIWEAEQSRMAQEEDLADIADLLEDE